MVRTESPMTRVKARLKEAITHSCRQNAIWRLYRKNRIHEILTLCTLLGPIFFLFFFCRIICLFGHGLIGVWVDSLTPFLNFPLTSLLLLKTRKGGRVWICVISLMYSCHSSRNLRKMLHMVVSGCEVKVMFYVWVSFWSYLNSVNWLFWAKSLFFSSLFYLF